MSWIIAIGGPLNVLRIMTWSVVGLLLIGGLALFAMSLWWLRSRIGTSGVIGWPKTRLDVLTLSTCLLVYGTWVCLAYSPFGDPAYRYRYTLNPWDDLQGGYITYPLRLLSEGNLGEDPFNDRRTVSSLGGASVLQSFALLYLLPTYIHLIDPGITILTLPLLLHGLGRRRGWASWLVTALTLLCFVFMSYATNASAWQLPILFLLSLYGLLEDLAMAGRPRLSELVAVALIAAAAMTLKQPLVPGTCFILGFFLVLDAIIRRDPVRSLVSGLTTGSVLLLLLAPWLFDMYRSAGTPLYPLLGEGHRANPMVDLPNVVPMLDTSTQPLARAKLMVNPRILLFIMLGAVGMVASMRRRLREYRGVAYLAVLLGSTATLIVFARIFFSEDTLFRYGHPFLSLVILTSFSVILGAEEERAWLDGVYRGGTRWVSGLLILIVLAGGVAKSLGIRTTVGAVFNAIAGKAWDPDAQRPIYRQLQESIPPGHRFLAFLPMAHLLNFARNPINVMDSNCGISPPPGMPLKSRPEEVARYLRSLGISWIASRERSWTPAGESRDPEDIRRWSAAFVGKNQWDVSIVNSHYLMARCVRSLSTMYETFHFANDLIVINLGRLMGRGTPAAAGTGLDRVLLEDENSPISRLGNPSEEWPTSQDRLFPVIPGDYKDGAPVHSGSYESSDLGVRNHLLTPVQGIHDLVAQADFLRGMPRDQIQKIGGAE
jgi:hypothetical protein